jgi:hypothetical protein
LSRAESARRGLVVSMAANLCRFPAVPITPSLHNSVSPGLSPRGKPLFSGTALPPRLVGQNNQENHSYTVLPPWYNFTRTFSIRPRHHPRSNQTMSQTKTNLINHDQTQPNTTKPGLSNCREPRTVNPTRQPENPLLRTHRSSQV